MMDDVLLSQAISRGHRATVSHRWSLSARCCDGEGVDRAVGSRFPGFQFRKDGNRYDGPTREIKVRQCKTAEQKLKSHLRTITNITQKK
jgi:hypothetical protein